MGWIAVAAVLWLIGAATPWGREHQSFTERLGDPVSLPAGLFVVAAVTPIVGVAVFVVGMFVGG